MARRSNKAVATAFLQSFSGDDPESAINMLGDDCTYIDSTADQISGRAACEQAIRRFFSLGLQFTVEIDQVYESANLVLIKGRTHSDVRHLNAACHWRIKVSDGKIAEYQSFRGDRPPAIIRMLLKEDGSQRSQVAQGYDGRLGFSNRVN